MNAATHALGMLDALRAMRPEPTADVRWPERWGREHLHTEAVGGVVRARPANAAWLGCPDCCGSGYETTTSGAAPCLRCGGLRRRVRLVSRAGLPAAALAMRPYDFTRPGLPRGLHAAMTAMTEPDGAGVTLSGGCGTGKTHLAYAVTLRRTADRGLPTRFVSWSAHLQRVKAAFGQGAQADELRTALASVPGLLVIDDLGAERGTEWTRGEATWLIDARYRKGLRTMVTTNLNPAAALGEALSMRDALGERVTSRLAEMCPALGMGASDFRLTARG